MKRRGVIQGPLAPLAPEAPVAAATVAGPTIKLDGLAKLALETGRTRLLVAGLMFALAFLAVGLR